jgi:SAM-dependent methyltransferase
MRSGQLLEAAAITGLTSVLLSPIAWQHHGVWVVPAIGALVGRPGSRLRSGIIAAVVVVLALGVFVAEIDLQVMTYLVLLGMLVLQVRSSSTSEVVVTGLDSSPERYQREAYHDVMYTGAVGTFSGLVHRIMERPFRHRSSGDVLEVGAGAGQHAAYVESFDSYLETDIAERPEQGPAPRPGVVRELLDAQDLSAYPDASFDRVIATCLLAHLDRPEAALQEWRRVTRPGGTVTVYVPCEPGMLLRLARVTIMVPKARRFAQDHVATVYREHRNHYPAMRMLLDSTFRDDDVRRGRWPVPFVGWNFALFDVVHATRRD